jgi:hypothetical protein
MIRIRIVSYILAGGIAVLATAQANAQSPDPALLAPGQSGRLMAPPRSTEAPPTYKAPGSGGHTGYMSRNGRHLSHRSTHNHGG